MDRERHNDGDYYCFRHYEDVNRVNNGGMTSRPPIASSSYSSPARPGVGGGCYIEHRVSKMDTLVGVAIKYGVEVADVKRTNGLVTDLQMFALKTLHIPLPGRHPPSSSLSNGLDNQGPSSSGQTSHCNRNSDLFESFASLKLISSPKRRASPAMSNLQGYYDLKATDTKTASEGFEMAVYRKAGSHCFDDGQFAQPPPLSNSTLSPIRKSKSLANGFLSENGELAQGNFGKWRNKLFRRCHKSEADFTSRTPEKLLKEDNGSVSGFSTITGKGLALRPKAARRASTGADAGGGLGDSLVAESFDGVRKSSSASSLQDQDNNGSPSFTCPTSKWSLKSDLQALSTAAIKKPIFDGLPKPITGRKGKAALD